MSSLSELRAECRDALDEKSVLDYQWDNDDLDAFINRVLREIYPSLYRLVTDNAIRLDYNTLTYNLSTLQPPVEGLIGVYIVSSDGEYYVRRHYDYNPASKLLTFQPNFYRWAVASSSSQTGYRLYPVYRSYFTKLVDEDQECELAPPDEELILLGVQPLALRKQRFRMLQGRANLPTETWNEFERIVQDAERVYQKAVASKQMVRHGGYPSTRRRRVTTSRVRSW